MYIGSIGSFSNDEDWVIPGTVDDDDGSALTLTGSTIEFYITGKNTPTTAEVTATNSNGKITLPTTTSFEIALTPADVADLCAEQYRVFFKITVSGEKTQLISGTVDVVEGGP